MILRFKDVNNTVFNTDFNYWRRLQTRIYTVDLIDSDLERSARSCVVAYGRNSRHIYYDRSMGYPLRPSHFQIQCKGPSNTGVNLLLGGMPVGWISFGMCTHGYWTSRHGRNNADHRRHDIHEVASWRLSNHEMFSLEIGIVLHASYPCIENVLSSNMY